MKKTIARILASLIVCAMLLVGIPEFHSTTVVAQAEISVEEADILEWWYKLENGKLYRRLWNATKAYWVTEWEWCP